MKLMDMEVIALAVGRQPKSRLRLTWQEDPTWIGRLLFGLKPVEVSTIFVGTGRVWHALPRWQRVSPRWSASSKSSKRD